MMSGDFSFLPRSEGNNLLKPHSYGDWLSISTAQALHMLLGEGNPALRRAESAALNRAAGVYLNLDIGWTLLGLCVLQFQSIGVWARIAEARRRRRLGATSRATR